MERSRTAREAAERALVRLAVELGPNVERLIVIGGLNADLLTLPQDVPHQGTTDIDTFIDLPVIYERDDEDFRWLEEGLRSAGFEEREGWRWATKVGSFEVRLELLTDVYDSPGQSIALPGTDVASAQNIDGPRAVRTDTIRRQLPVDPGDRRGGHHEVTLQFVGLGGYLLAKAAAILGRSASKDTYDLAFVLLHNIDGGPGPAGRAAARVADGDQERLFLSALRRFEGVDSEGAQQFATQRIADGVDADPDALAQDAVAAAAECRRAFLDERAERR